MSNKILIVIDAQNDFIDGALANPDAQKAIPSLIKRIEEFDGKEIIYTYDTHNSNYMSTLEGKMLPVPHCLEGTEGFDYNKEVLEAIKHNDAASYAIHKRTFGYSSWGAHLRQPEEIYICGFCTDICVISNALLLRATYPDTRIFCYADACAGVTPDKHEAALKVMESCQIEVI